MGNRSKDFYWDLNLTEIEILGEKEIVHLPKPVQNYIIQSGALGKPKVKTARLRQKGIFNINGKKWTPIKAEQYFNVEKCEFIWNAKAGVIHVVDQYKDDRGSLTVKLFGLIKLAQASGKEVDQGEILRYLSETMWFPSAFISELISWESLDDYSAKAIIKYGEEMADAIFHFTANGLINKITAKRYAEKNGKFELHDWEISNLEYKVINDINLPLKAHVTWKYDEGDLCYYKLEIIEIEYNVTEKYK